MITVEQYFTKPRPRDHEQSAIDLIRRRNALRAEWMAATGKDCPIDPDTGTEISGVERGDGDGGYRTPGSRTGAAGSSHRHGQGIDDYDPGDELDTWLDAFEHDGENTKLEEHGLYREHPEATPGWCHLATRAPGSGRRTFRP